MRIAGKISLVAACVLLSACTKGAQQDTDGGKAETKSAAAPSPAPVPRPAARAALPQSLTSKTSALEFGYRWPSEAASIPELDRWLRANGEKLRGEARGEAMSDQAEAKKDSYPFNAHSYEEEFKTVANTPRILVLLSDGYAYTGGAHGMPINTAILWEKAAKRRLATGALLNLPRLATLAKTQFCDELDRQRTVKRGEPVNHDDKNQIVDFVNCVDMTKQLVLPISKGGRVLDTIEVVIGPYEAGPYAEGSYIIDLPMDARLMAAVKTPYRDVFGMRQP